MIHRPRLTTAWLGVTSALLALTLFIQIGQAAPPLRLEITRDTWVSAYPGETNGNNGGASRLKTKGIVELSLLDFDPAPLQGKTIRKAWLYLKPASADHQLRLTVSSISADWNEGTGNRYDKMPGGASFNWAMQDQQPWAWPGSDITSVMAGQGNSLWGFADASEPDAAGYQRVAVDPRVLAIRVANLSRGLALMDDVGSSYIRHGEQFTYQLFPNRFLYSRTAAANQRPYLVVELGEDDAPPQPVTDLHATPAILPPGQCQLTWTTPGDQGLSGTLGFLVTVAPQNVASSAASPVPLWIIPLAGKPGESVTMTLRDLPVDFSRPAMVSIRAVDGAGNASPAAMLVVPARKDPPPMLTLPPPSAPFEAAGELPVLQNPQQPQSPGKVFVLDALDKINPVTGQLIPDEPPDYKLANHLWSASLRTIALHGASNEFVSFQFVVQGDSFPEAVVLLDDQPPAPPITARISRFAQIPGADGALPDPVIPLGTREPHPVANTQFHAGLVEFYIPHHTPPGDHTGTLLLTQGGQTLALSIKLHVWNFTLPDHLSFIPQMNAYGLGNPADERAYYRLAHIHRTALNRLPYNWQGRVQDGGAPALSAGGFNWVAWDKRFGPLFDGSAFADLPRKSVPIENFYLPLNENWPASIDRGFTQGYWADAALTPAYRRQFTAASRAFAQHFKDKGWNDTFFEFFLNGKIYFKRKAWSAGSSPWIFDEPVNTQDFWALRTYGQAFHEGLNLARKIGEPFPKLVFRADISRPQWQRDTLDGVLDVNVVGGVFIQYQREVNQRAAAHHEILFNYGSTNPINQPNTQPVGWCLDTWLRGGDGVVPWQTMGSSASWNKQDDLALFYPGQPAGLKEPVPSIRLKAYRQGQQLVEYLTILSQMKNLPRWAMDQAVRDRAGLDQPHIQQHGEDAANITFSHLTPQSLWKLRLAAGMMLDQLVPPAKDQWVELRTPAREPTKLPGKEVD